MLEVLLYFGLGLLAFGLLVWGFLSIPGVEPFLDRHRDKIATIGCVYILYWVLILTPMMGGGHDNSASVEVMPIGASAESRYIEASVNSSGSISSPVSVRLEYVINYLSWSDSKEYFKDDSCRISRRDGGKCESLSGNVYFIKVEDFYEPGRNN